MADYSDIQFVQFLRGEQIEAVKQLDNSLSAIEYAEEDQTKSVSNNPLQVFAGRRIVWFRQSNCFVAVPIMLQGERFKVRVETEEIADIGSSKKPLHQKTFRR